MMMTMMMTHDVDDDGDKINMIKSQPAPVDSMREAVFTVSPNKQYLGIACPTTPVKCI